MNVFVQKKTNNFFLLIQIYEEKIKAIENRDRSLTKENK
jgi:hypothetical protein